MNDLQAQLQEILQGRVCVVGVGNVECGDDGFGVRLAERLKSEIRNPKSETNPNFESRNRDGKGHIGSRSDPAKVAVGFNPRCDREEMPSSRSDDRASVSLNRRSVTDAARPSPVRGLKSRATFVASLRDDVTSECDLEVIVAGTTPERHLSQFTDSSFDSVVFLDAVEFGGEPGAVVLLNSTEMAAHFPQVSTHKLSLGMLAKLVEASGRTKAWLLGVQPESLREGTSLSPRVQASVELLADLLAEVAQTSSLLYRRLPVGRPSELSSACGLQIRDTAEWNSALRLPAAANADTAFRIPHSALPC